MPDEQIMIDGVDVSGCENLMQGIVPFGCMEDRKTCSCMNNPNCYYKQLVRKEQKYKALEGRLKYILNENKALKDCASDEHIDIVALKNYISTLEFHIDQLKAENEELKNTINEAKNAGIDLKSFLLGEAIQEEYEEKIKELKASKEQAEQKLEKIRQVCTKAKDVENIKDMYTAKLSGLYLKSRQILQIIDEVK